MAVSRVGRVALALVLVSVMLLAGLPAAQGQEASPAGPAPAPANSGTPALPRGGSQTTRPSSAASFGGMEDIQGIVSVAWGDALPGSGGGATDIVYLTEPNGQISVVSASDKVLRAAGGIAALDRTSVT